MSSFLEVPDALIEAIAERVIAKLGIKKPNRKPLTVSEAATRLGVSEATIRRRIEAGLIRAVPDLGVTLVPHSEIVRLIGEDAGG